MEREVIEVLLERGLTLAQVSMLTGDSIAAIQRLDLHSNRKPRHSYELRELAKELQAQGLSSSEIGRAINVPASTIRSWL